MSTPIVRISRTQAWRDGFIREHGYRCHYCNRFAASVDVGPDGKPWHVEHMDALANGGADDESNLTLSCERCNSLKGVLAYANFRRYARSVFWVGEPSRLSLQDLELLEASFLRAADGRWMCRETDGDAQTAEVFSVDEMSDSLDDASLIGEFQMLGTSSRTGGMHNINFVLQAHRLMPRLIAEIHILHAELSLLRAEQATPDAA